MRSIVQQLWFDFNSRRPNINGNGLHSTGGDSLLLFDFIDCGFDVIKGINNSTNKCQLNEIIDYSMHRMRLHCVNVI